MNTKRLFLLFSLFLIAIRINAYDFEVDGIYYNITSLDNNEVEATHGNTYSSGDVVLPEYVTFNHKTYKVTGIGDRAFDGGHVHSLTIPSTVIKLSDTFVHPFPENLNILLAFYVDEKNPKFTSSDGVLYSKDMSELIRFPYKKSGEFEVPSSVKTIKKLAFKDCGSISSIISASVEIIESNSFSWCYNLKSAIFGESLTEMGDSVFYRSDNLEKIEFSNVLTQINPYTFYYCKSLTSVTIPNSVTTIGASAFESCNRLSNIKLPQFLLTIGRRAFLNCESISSITIPYSVTSIGNSTFANCSNLKAVISEIQSPFYIEEKVFSNISSEAILQIPKGTKSKYEAFTGWTKYFSQIIEAGSSTAATYSLSITASGNGSVSFNSTTVRSKTQSFTVNEGTSATVSFSPDNGYRIASVKVNNTDVTSSVSNSSYTISSISANTTLSVTFEAIPPTTYTLSITASGNGNATYSSTTIKNKTQSFTVNEGTSAAVTFSPDSGYRIASVKVNNADVTSSVSNNSYTISNISANTTLSVTFEAIPITTYSLNITASGNGSVTYSGTAIRGKGQSFNVNEGGSATVSFSPDSGYRIASVKVNNTDVTTSVSNNRYTISNITANTTIEVTFEAIPPTTYNLSIKATGNGSVAYNGASVKNQTKTFTLNEGANAPVAIIPDNGYRIASVKVNGANVTSSVSNNQYTIANIRAHTSMEVVFEAIPVTTYSLSVKATGNGSATYAGTTVKNETKTFTVNEGSNVTITFSPDNGNRINSVKLNGTDITSQAQNNWYSINNISANASIEVAFVEDINALTVEGINYAVVSQADKTIKVAGGNYGQVLTVPASVTSNGSTWTITGIENEALKGNSDLAAVVWNPSAPFTAEVSNPNLLLYVTAEQYAAANIKNVVVNGTANSITLTDAANGNNFYCPQAFTALHISYTHNYSMSTGINETRGWETIALPFDVQKVTHGSKGDVVPFAAWKEGDIAKPFWLYELTGSGFVEAASIKANTPYIISMPNNPQYYEQWLLNGSVTFEASGITVGRTEESQSASFRDRILVPNFVNRALDEGLHALNVANDYAANNSGMTEGSKFVLNMRQIHPFEAYMKSTSNAPRRVIDIFEDMATSIRTIECEHTADEQGLYDLQGRKVQGVKKGVYIRNGKKVIIK